MTSKVIVGSTVRNRDKFRRVWMDGTPQEIVEKLTNRFHVYTERPTKEKLKKKTVKTASLTKAKTTNDGTTAKTPETAMV